MLFCKGSIYLLKQKYPASVLTTVANAHITLSASLRKGFKTVSSKVMIIFILPSVLGLYLLFIIFVKFIQLQDM